MAELRTRIRFCSARMAEILAHAGPTQGARKAHAGHTQAISLLLLDNVVCAVWAGPQATQVLYR